MGMNWSEVWEQVVSRTGDQLYSQEILLPGFVKGWRGVGLATGQERPRLEGGIVDF